MLSLYEAVWTLRQTPRGTDTNPMTSRNPTPEVPLKRLVGVPGGDPAEKDPEVGKHGRGVGSC